MSKAVSHSMERILKAWPLPNFLYVGTDKAGSTWLGQALALHPEVFVTPAKDLYFFDKEYSRGLDWYRRQFRGWRGQSRIGELSHDYLYSDIALERMSRILPDAAILVTVREPVERAISAYRYLLRHDEIRMDFGEAIAQREEIVGHGLYGTRLNALYEWYPRDQIFIGDFSELRSDPARFISEVFQFLQLDEIELPYDSLRPHRGAARARSKAIAGLAKRGARMVRRMGFPKLVGRIKNSGSVQRVLYQDEASMQPEVSGSVVKELRGRFASEVQRLSELSDIDFAGKWGYTRL